MRLAVAIWRFLLWTMGIVFVPAMGYALWLEAGLAWRYGYPVLGMAVTSFWMIAALSGPIAAWGLKRAKPWATRAGWIAAALQTLALPIFTPFGLLGLILMALGAGKVTVAVDEPAPSPAQKGPFPWNQALRAIALSEAAIGTYFAFDFWGQALGYPHSIGALAGFLAFGAGFVIQIFIHEAGHALAVLWVGGHLHRFHVGPLAWRRESGRTWIARMKSASLAGSICWTPGNDIDVTRQRLLVAAAGPLANLAAFIFAAALFPLLGFLGAAGAWHWVADFAVCALLGMSNILPDRAGFHETDGLVVQSLRKDPRYRRISALFLRNSMSESSPLRPHEWTRPLIEWALWQTDEGVSVPLRSGILQIALHHYLDSGLPDEATSVAWDLACLTAEHPAACPPDFYPEAVFTLAFHAKDLDAARELWNRRPKTEQVQFELAEFLAEAAIAEPADRPEAIRKAWTCSAKYQTSGTMEFLRDQLRRLEADVNSRSALSLAELASAATTVEPAAASSMEDLKNMQM
jgi:hypothetical protein